MKEVRSQKEFEKHYKNGERVFTITGFTVVLKENSHAVLWGNSHAELWENSHAVLWGNSHAVLWGNSHAELRENSHAVLWENSHAELRENSHAELRENSHAELRENSHAELRENSHAVLWGNSHAELWGNSHAVLRENSHAVLRENSHAVLWENSHAELWGNSHAVLRENSHAVLWGNSHAELWENSHAELRDFSIAHILSDLAKYKKGSQAYIVKPVYPSDMREWCKLKCIKIKNNRIQLWKCVDENGFDFKTRTVNYIQKNKNIECPDWEEHFTGECGHGLHLADSPASAKSFVSSESLKTARLIVVSTNIDDCRCYGGYPYYPEKIRTKQCRFVREYNIDHI